MEENKKCWDCKYKGSVPGNAHICCKHPQVEKLNIKGNEYGIRMGWFMFPICFDPTWLENCDGFTKKS